MIAGYENIKSLYIKIDKGDDQEECFYGYDSLNHLTLDVEKHFEKDFISETKFKNFMKSLIELINQWDYEYYNPLGGDDFRYHLEFETFEGYKIVYEGYDGFPNNYKEVSKLINRYCKFNIWCGADEFEIYNDFKSIEPIYKIMEFFQDNHVDENLNEIVDSLMKNNIIVENPENEIKNNGLDIENITNFDIDRADDYLVKAIFTYLFNKNYIKGVSCIENEHMKMLNCIYKIIENSFFK